MDLGVTSYLTDQDGNVIVTNATPPKKTTPARAGTKPKAHGEVMGRRSGVRLG